MKEFEKFDNGMKTVLSVSREELKRREEEWKKTREAKRKPKAPASPASVSSSNRI